MFASIYHNRLDFLGPQVCKPQNPRCHIVWIIVHIRLTEFRRISRLARYGECSRTGRNTSLIIHHKTRPLLRRSRDNFKVPPRNPILPSKRQPHCATSMILRIDVQAPYIGYDDSNGRIRPRQASAQVRYIQSVLWALIACRKPWT